MSAPPASGSAPQGVIPHLTVSGAAAALDFYAKALGAEELPETRVLARDGERLMHAEILVNGCLVFVMDDFPEFREQHGNGSAAPDVLRGTPVTLHLAVPDCDAAVRRAAEAGARVVMEPEDAFWGDRFGCVADPFGHLWSFSHPLAKEDA